ncbi:hypothetical protein, partial [Paracoccus sp. FO-3]|uniref:hypothetical protein n=1 Tax=Paracoccus sp. FO-3 TaxID=1335059 RepID=UPI001C6157B4
KIKKNDKDRQTHEKQRKINAAPTARTPGPTQSPPATRNPPPPNKPPFPQKTQEQKHENQTK